MGVESGALRQPRPRGIAPPLCYTLTADGGGAADTATSLHRALRVRSGGAVAVAGEVAELQSARQQVAAAARRRRRGPHRQDSRPRQGAGGRRARRRERGDAAGEALHLQQRGLARGGGGGRAWRRRAERAGGDPSEIRPRDRRRLVKFGELVWYRFSFKIARDWPHDVPVVGRHPCRTVIHQVEQDSFKDGKSCDASPFFKIEARPLGERVRFFGQVATGTPCARPPTVTRSQICQRDLPRESWTTVQVRLNPAHDASGRVDVWLNGTFCGAYEGPMADRDYGARRNGAPFIDAQPRFGIYRDWRAETQTIYFDKIMFWNADPSGHPDWG